MSARTSAFFRIWAPSLKTAAQHLILSILDNLDGRQVELAHAVAVHYSGAVRSDRAASASCGFDSLVVFSKKSGRPLRWKRAQATLT
jgi:hypothetical protein